MVNMKLFSKVMEMNCLSLLHLSMHSSFFPEKCQKINAAQGVSY